MSSAYRLYSRLSSVSQNSFKVTPLGSGQGIMVGRKDRSEASCLREDFILNENIY